MRVLMLENREQPTFHNFTLVDRYEVQRVRKFSIEIRF
jgi:hypothetical protein